MPKKPVIRHIFVNAIQFLKTESAGGILLLGCAAIALYLANSQFAEAFEHLLHLPITIGIAPVSLTLGMQHWINDALMAVFFFVVGMEIKHELMDGALAGFDRAALPVFAAIGGMVSPALLFFVFGPDFGGPASSGWGIPMATDIAFAVGVMALLGRAVSAELKIFVLALAIADDLGAVAVIALFYASGIALMPILAAVLISVLIYVLAAKNLRWIWLHAGLGLLLWIVVYKSGIHATVAGVILGFLMPHDDMNPDDPTPLERWVKRLHPMVSFFIMPVFALANAGVAISSTEASAFVTNVISDGVAYGLWIGKPLGIFLASWLAVKVGIAKLPQSVKWSQILGAGALGGIGFTMALFIAGLALPNPQDLALAKVGILKGSLLAAITGAVILKIAGRKREVEAKPRGSDLSSANTSL